MQIVCRQCGKEFRAAPSCHRSFCSYICFANWETGENNGRWIGRIFICAYCSKSFHRAPSSEKRFNYCSTTCSHLHDRIKQAGQNNGNWRGGSLDNRGPCWQQARKETIKRQDHKCAICTMTEPQHIERYRKSFHVHHRDPFRRSLNNDPANLEALCIPCHAKEESKARKQLTPADRALMIERSILARERGFATDDMERHYDQCPHCKGKKRKNASLCISCRKIARRVHRKPQYICPRCGKFKPLASAANCGACYKQLRKLGLAGRWKHN